MIKNAVTEESRLELQEKLRDSTKLKYLAGWSTPKANYITMVDLDSIQFLARCRLSCLLEFEGDFGNQVTGCRCGNPNTFNHVREGCMYYANLLLLNQ